MATLNEIIARAEALRKESYVNSIDPERVGSIMSDTLKYLNEFQLQSGSMGLDKIYTSISAMNADTSPVSDLTGKPLKAGQLAVVVTSDSGSADNGRVYRFDKPGWTYISTVAGLNLAQEPGTGDNRVMSQKAVTDLVSEYNVSIHFPTDGIDGTNRYTLETAIAKIPAALRNVGIKCSFIGEDGTSEVWEYQGGNFSDTGRWLKAYNTKECANNNYPSFATWARYSKGTILEYMGRIYRMITDKEAMVGFNHKIAEIYPMSKIRRDYCEQDYYYKKMFIGHDSYSPVYYEASDNFCYIEFPYKEGDDVVILNAATGGAYDKYNFFMDDEPLGSSNEEWSVDLIPEGCNRIKVNGNPKDLPIVIVNGIGINRTSEAYRLGLLFDNIEREDEEYDCKLRMCINEWHSLITDYGAENCIQPSKPFITISRDGSEYRILAKNATEGSFIAKTSGIDASLLSAGRRLAYFIDVDILQRPEGQIFSFGAISKEVGRKDIRGLSEGDHLRSVLKVELDGRHTSVSDCSIFLPISTSAALNQTWEYLYHVFAIIDCGTDSSNPLYNLTEEEILNILGGNVEGYNDKVFSSKGVVVSGIKNYNGAFIFADNDNNEIAVIDDNGIKVHDVKDMSGKEMFLRSAFFGKEFFTVGDSLCAGNQWQPRLAQLTGAYFDNEYNRSNISVGGTRSLGASAYSGQNRLKKLIEEKSPEIIILENINDIGVHDIDEVDYSYMISETSVSQTIYDDAASARAAKTSEIALIPEQSRSIGHALRIGYHSENGVKLTISGVAAGNRTCIVRVGRTSAQIEINAGDTAADVVAKIYEVYWAGYEKFTDNVTYVAFVNSDGGTADIGTFMLDGNGIAVTENTYASTSYVDYYFIGQTVDEPSFNDASNWTENVPMVAVYKGMFEYIFSKLPTCRVIWFIPTRLAIQWNEGENGWDAGLWLEKGVRVNMQYYQSSYSPKVTYDSFREFQKKVAEMYGVEVYDINDVCGINPYNHKTFYPSYNVHPLQAGYDRWAETLAKMIL